jgi:organic radical activating enzyme
LKVSSIFLSVNGECCKWGQGSWAVFVKISSDSTICELTIPVIIDRVAETGKGIKRVVILGDEPTEQKQLDCLLGALRTRSFEVSVETNGVEPRRVRDLIKKFPEVSWVVDYKLKSAGDVSLFSSVKLHDTLHYGCFSRFVISNYEDFHIAESVVEDLYPCMHRLYFSPEQPLDPIKLYRWMKESEICIRSFIGYSYPIQRIIFKEG